MWWLDSSKIYGICIIFLIWSGKLRLLSNTINWLHSNITSVNCGFFVMAWLIEIFIHDPTRSRLKSGFGQIPQSLHEWDDWYFRTNIMQLYMYSHLRHANPLHTSIIRLPNSAGHRCLSHFRSYMGTYLRVGFISSYLCGSLENTRWKSTLYKYQMLLETHFAQNFFKCYKQFGTKPNLLAKISATNIGNLWA